MLMRKARTSPEASLSKLDKAIIEVLRTNGRATSQYIAARLSVSSQTVSARLQKMEDARAMRVVAVSDFAALDYNVIIAAGIHVQGRNIHDVGRDLAQFSEVLSVNVMNGSHDLELLIALHDSSDIKACLYDHIASVDGVAQIDSGVAVDIVKYEFNVAPL